jgi:hypothetical protein
MQPARSTTHQHIGPATRRAVQVFGVIAAAAGIEHGVGELRQGAIPPPALVFQSWPDAPAFEVLAGEPALWGPGHGQDGCDGRAT